MMQTSLSPTSLSSTEISVTIKNEEANYKKKFLIYESYAFSEFDPIVKECIGQTLKEFNQEHTDITVRAVLHL
jgi:hypothetical protein